MSYKARMVASSPTALQGPYGTSWSRGVGQGLDDLLADYKAAVKARFPTVAAANGDTVACNYIGQDSSLPRYPSESLTAYGARLQARWQRYARSGAAAGPGGAVNPIVQDLEGLELGGITIMEYVDWPAAASPANAHSSPSPVLDSLGTPWWSRFWIFVESYQGAPIPPGFVWGTGTWGTGYWGFTLPPAVVSGAIASGLQWKPAHVLFAGITFLVDDLLINSVWGAGGTWGNFVWGSNGGVPHQTFIYVNK